MKIYVPIIIIGVILTIFGIIFHLQGQSIIGPESSFMYSNPEWVTNGLEIMVIGIIILGVGMAIKIIKKS